MWIPTCYEADIKAATAQAGASTALRKSKVLTLQRTSEVEVRYPPQSRDGPATGTRFSKAEARKTEVF
jgi:hypothetical protein